MVTMEDHRPGVVLDLGGGWALRRWSDSDPIRLENADGSVALVRPGPEQVELELEHDWYGCCSKGRDTVYREIPVHALRALLGVM
jgi:hypothetical protein